MNQDETQNNQNTPSAASQANQELQIGSEKGTIRSIDPESTIRLLKRFGLIISLLSAAILLITSVPHLLTGGSVLNLLTGYLILPLIQFFIGLGLVRLNRVAFVLFQILAFINILLLLTVVPMSIATGGARPPFTDPMWVMIGYVVLALELATIITWVWGFFTLDTAKVHSALNRR